MFKIVLTARAVRDLEGLERKDQVKIASRLREYAVQPLNHARKLLSSKVGSYRFRIGDYRVIFDLGKDEIIILRIGHRKNIYR